MIGSDPNWKVPEHPDDCFVYVISIDDLGLSKIGVSRYPESRLRQLRTGSPFEMRIAHAYRIPSKEIAHLLEGAFHRKERASRTSGEWFKIPAEDAVVNMLMNIMSYLVVTVGISPRDVDRAIACAGIPDWLEPHVFKGQQHYLSMAQ